MEYDRKRMPPLKESTLKSQFSTASGHRFPSPLSAEKYIIFKMQMTSIALGKFVQLLLTPRPDLVAVHWKRPLRLRDEDWKTPFNSILMVFSVPHTESKPKIPSRKPDKNSSVQRNIYSRFSLQTDVIWNRSSLKRKFSKTDVLLSGSSQKPKFPETEVL